MKKYFGYFRTTLTTHFVNKARFPWSCTMSKTDLIYRYLMIKKNLFRVMRVITQFKIWHFLKINYIKCRGQVKYMCARNSEGK